MKIKMVVACEDSNGKPFLYGCIIECSDRDFKSGQHYETAKRYAKEDGYSVFMNSIIFDQYDDPGLIAYVEGK